MGHPMGAALNAFAFTFEGCISPSTNWNAGGQFHRVLHRPKVGGKVPIEPAFVLLWLDLIGVFVFAVDGGLVARALTRLDIVGVVGLGMVTALGGGVMRDLLLPDLPPASFRDWRYLLVALVGGLIAFAVSEEVSRRVERPIKLLEPPV